MRTKGLFIVEKSYRDDFWGAKPVDGGHEGGNSLGMCLMQLRSFMDWHEKDEELVTMYLSEYIFSSSGSTLQLINEQVISYDSFKESLI